MILGDGRMRQPVGVWLEGKFIERQIDIPSRPASCCRYRDSLQRCLADKGKSLEKFGLFLIHGSIHCQRMVFYSRNGSFHGYLAKTKNPNTLKLFKNLF